MSYGRLIRVVDRMAVRMREVGVGRWGIVGLHIADPMLHALAALSLLRLSVASVTLPDARVPHGLPVEVIFSDQSSGARSSNIREISFSWLNDEESSSRSVIELVVPVGEFARVMLTSGSTGFPKAVPISWQDLAWRLASYDYAYGSGFAQASRRLLNFMSLNSSLGYMYLLYVLQRGGTMCFPSAEFELTVAACNGYRIEGLVSSPITLSEIVRAADGRRGLFETVQAVFTTGSRLDASLAHSVTRTVCPHVVSSYGSTEIGSIASGSASTLLRGEHCVGRLLPDVEAAAFDGDARLPEGSIGQLGFKARGGVAGYLSVHDAGCSSSESHFRNGWFLPGDMGFCENGLLFVVGRAANVLNIGGDKIAAEKVEQTLRTVPGVADAVAVTFMNKHGVERLAVHLVTCPGWSLDMLLACTVESLPASAQPEMVATWDKLPKTVTGKLDRQALDSGGGKVVFRREWT